MESSHPYIAEKSAEEIIEDLAKPVAEPGSVVHEAYLAALQVRIAEMQRETARVALTWAKVAALSTAVAALIALVALLVVLPSPFVGMMNLSPSLSAVRTAWNISLKSFVTRTVCDPPPLGA